MFTRLTLDFSEIPSFIIKCGADLTVHNQFGDTPASLLYRKNSKHIEVALGSAKKIKEFDFS